MTSNQTEKYLQTFRGSFFLFFEYWEHLICIINVKEEPSEEE